MKFSKYDKGVAGLNLFLSLVVSLFIIGLIVMIFALMSAGLQDATYTSTTGTVTDESLATVNNATAVSFANAGLRDASCSSVVFWNSTGGETIIATGNYTLTNCQVIALTTSPYIGTDGVVEVPWDVNYTYVYSADNDATYTIGNTSDALSSSVDWFDIFIIIGAMVVLILLVVIIIAAIRGSGLVSAEAGA
jgi:hypothetical protein